MTEQTGCPVLPRYHTLNLGWRTLISGRGLPSKSVFSSLMSRLATPCARDKQAGKQAGQMHYAPETCIGARVAAARAGICEPS